MWYWLLLQGEKGKSVIKGNISMKKLSSEITAVLFAACISLNTFASTITVNWDGTGDFTTIQDAIDVAVYGDTINVKEGTYIENIDS